MSDLKQLLAIKKEKKARAPEFIRQDSWLRLKIGNKPRWRRPKGKHSKMRENRIGKHPRVEIGYRNPALVRGLTLTGMAPKLIHNIEELQRLNKQTDIAIVSATVGLKSRLEIAKKAQELGIKTNLKQEKLNERLAALKKQHEAKKIAVKETTKAEAREQKTGGKTKPVTTSAQAEPAKAEIKPEVAQTAKTATAKQNVTGTSPADAGKQKHETGNIKRGAK